MRPDVHIWLDVPRDRSYFLAIHAGIRAFAARGKPWLFQLVGGLRSWHPQGIIALFRDSAHEQEALDLGCAVVNISSRQATSRVPRVIPDNRLAGRMAAEHLLDCGLRHLGVVATHAQGLFYDVERLRGFRDAAEARGVPTHVCAGLAGAGERMEDVIDQWLRALPKPVGVFATGDQVALAAMDLCRLAGLLVPDDVAIVGAENDEVLCEIARPPLTSVDLAGWRVGFGAAALLDRQLRGLPTPDEEQRIPPGRVVIRRSTNCAAIIDPDVRQAVEYITAHVGEPIHLADIMTRAQVSYATLLRRFRQERGRTIQDEVLAAQLARARALLIETDLPIADIALRAGFCGHAHFAHTFRTHIGVTPSAIREQFRVPE